MENPLNILVINCGSSSLKFSFYDAAGQTPVRIVSGFLDAIGKKESALRIKTAAPGNGSGSSDGNQEKISCGRISSHGHAVETVIRFLREAPEILPEALAHPTAVGHRVVHGGEDFISPVMIDDNVLSILREKVELAPLHNPLCIQGIEAAQKLLPQAAHVAVFDTAFHQTLPPESYLYAIDYRFYREYGIRRYGFHGSSHKYVYFAAARFLKTDPACFKAVTCHLGSGASIAAIKGGNVKDTSMGFTPLEGLVMATRSGDIDPAVIPFLAGKEKISENHVLDMLNRESGLLGISGRSNDMRILLREADAGSRRSRLAIDVWLRRIIRYIGAFTAVLQGTDAIIFTGGIGEQSARLRKKIMEKLSWLNIECDDKINASHDSGPVVISTRESSIRVLIVPTDEEQQIAQETLELTVS